MWLQNEGRYRLTLDDAVDRMALLTGVGVAYARELVRQGLGELWDRHGGGGIQLRRPGKLQRQAYMRTGVGKHSVISMPVWMLGAGLEWLHAYLALPVMSSKPDKPTALAYTAKILGVSLCSVSRWRTILRGLAVLSTVPVYHRLGASKGDRQLAAKGGRRVFRRGGSLWVRDPDLVAVVGAKINAKEKTLRVIVTTQWATKSSDQLGRDASRFGRLSDQYFELYSSRPGDPSLRRQWAYNTLRRRRKLTTGGRWRGLGDPITGELDPDALHRLLLAEAVRLRGQRERSLAAYYAMPSEARL